MSIITNIYTLKSLVESFDASKFIPTDVEHIDWDFDPDSMTNWIPHKPSNNRRGPTGWGLATAAIIGVPQTKEHIEKRAMAKSRAIQIDGVTYKSGKEAATLLGYSVSTISVWAKNNGSRFGITIPTGSNQYVNRGNQPPKISD